MYDVIQFLIQAGKS